MQRKNKDGVQTKRKRSKPKSVSGAKDDLSAPAKTISRKKNRREPDAPPKEQPAIRIPKGSELIADSIRKQIVLGELQENEQLSSEQELIASLGVSRPTLREAFRILEAEGLIEVKRGAYGGARIKLPQIETATRFVGMLLQIRGATYTEMLEAISIIQPPLVAQLAREHTNDDLAALSRHIEYERENLAEFSTFALATIDFHKMIVQRARNVPLAVMIGLLELILRRYTMQFIARARPDLLDLNKRTLRNHERVFEKIRAGDASGAERIWRAHMREMVNVLTSELGGSSVLDLYQ